MHEIEVAVCSDMNSPTFSSAALGFRLWRLDPGEGLLSSVTANYWRPGINIAHCAQHVAPQEDCGCGLYAYYDLRSAEKRRYLAFGLNYVGAKLMAGAVACRGQSWLHHDGLRAEEAVILALAIPPGSTVSDQEAETTAKQYGVPLVAYDKLQEAGLRYADPVQEELRPGRPPAPSGASHPPRHKLEELERGLKTYWHTGGLSLEGRVLNWMLCILPPLSAIALLLGYFADVHQLTIAGSILAATIILIIGGMFWELVEAMDWERRYWNEKQLPRE